MGIIILPPPLPPPQPPSQPWYQSVGFPARVPIASDKIGPLKRTAPFTSRRSAAGPEVTQLHVHNYFRRPVRIICTPCKYHTPLCVLQCGVEVDELLLCAYYVSRVMMVHLLANVYMICSHFGDEQTHIGRGRFQFGDLYMEWKKTMCGIVVQCKKGPHSRILYPGVYIGAFL